MKPNHSPAGARLVVDQLVPMRDGVDLRADIHLPPAPGRHRTIVLSTPYGRRRPFLVRLARELGRTGFAVVVTEMRDPDASEEGKLYTHESTDASDVLAWIAGRPWTDGNVGLFAICGSALSAFFAAGTPPPEGVEVRAAINLIGSANLHGDCYRQGAMRLHWALPWSLMMERRGTRGGGGNGWQYLPWDDLFRQVPLRHALRRLGRSFGLWDRLAVPHPAYGEPWHPFDARRVMGSVRIPVLHVTGWYDVTLGQVLEAYRRLSAAAPQGAEQRLIVGPWDHGIVFRAFLGARKLPGRDRDGESIDLGTIVHQWFRRWLPAEGSCEAEAFFAGQPKVLLYTMDENRWYGEDQYPFSRTRMEEWYLGPPRRNFAGESLRGRLLRAPPARLSEASFRYDPAEPAPTSGGAIWPFPMQGLAPGPADQSGAQERGDTVVYASSPLPEDLVVLGPVEVELWISSTARDTDFVAKLVDVGPDGSSRLVQEGIIRCRFREGADREVLLEPGRPYRLRIDLASTGHRFRKRHRLRLDVSSSNFPEYDRNLNAGGRLFYESRPVVAEQTVYHGGEMRSRLRITVLEPSARREVDGGLPAGWSGASRSGATG